MKNKILNQAQKQIAAAVLVMLMLAMNSMADNVVMTASDSSGSDSFDTAAIGVRGRLRPLEIIISARALPSAPRPGLLRFFSREIL